MSTVRGEASGVRRPGPGDMPSFLVGEGGSEDERVGVGEGEGEGERERVGAAGPGATLKRMGPWNRKEHPSHSGSDSEARSSYCPRRKGGSFVDCSVKGYLKMMVDKQQSDLGQVTNTCATV